MLSLCCTSSVAKSERAQNGRKASVNVIVSRLTRGVSNVSRLPASTEDDLQLPFLVDDALQKDKDDLDSDSSEEEFGMPGMKFDPQS